VAASPAWSDARRSSAPPTHRANNGWTVHRGGWLSTITDRAAATPSCPVNTGPTRGFRKQDHPIAGFTRIVPYPITTCPTEPVLSTRHSPSRPSIGCICTCVGEVRCMRRCTCLCTCICVKGESRRRPRATATLHVGEATVVPPSPRVVTLRRYADTHKNHISHMEHTGPRSLLNRPPALPQRAGSHQQLG
jgi:hypothetical protein